jgi:predicted outer membrane repeat protein
LKVPKTNFEPLFLNYFYICLSINFLQIINMKNLFLTILVALVCFNVSASTIYVNGNATGANDGTSWTDAFVDLQDAIALSIFGDEIWVAQGTYKPTTGTSRSISFVIKNGTKVYGGFNGAELLLSERDFSLNTTILSGEIGSGSANDNSYKVVLFSNVANQTILDGFTISGGYNPDTGGGVVVNTSSPIIKNCIFSGNYGADGGGAINKSGAGILTIEGCVFDGNVGNTYGGGALRLYTGSANITNCYFKSNQSSAYGGAIYVNSCIVNIQNSVFAGNISQSSGSAIRVADVGTLHLSNSLVVGNFTNTSGTIYASTFSNTSAHTIKNVTVANNFHANNSGSSLVSAVAVNGETSIYNSIIYGNNTNIQVLNTGVTFSNSITTNATSSAPGTNLLTSNPNFINPGLASNAPFDTTGLNYRLDILSEGIDYGINANATGTTDLDGNPRIQNTNVDVGAYESNFCVSSNVFTSNAPYTICGGASITLEVNDVVQHLWSTGSTSNSISVSTAGNYSVIFEDINGCRGNLEASVSTAPNPSPNITFSSGSLNTGTFNSYQWYFNGALISGATNNSHVPIEGFGLYQVDVTNSGGCEGSETYCLSPAELNADGPTTFCDGDNVTLSVTNGDSHVWSTSSLNSSITVNSSGTYSVTVLNSTAGCSVSLQESIVVHANPNPTINFVNDNLTTSNFSTYQWYFNGNPISGAISQTLNPTATGNGQYSVSVTNSNGCEATSNVFNLTNLSIDEVEYNLVEYFPNPITNGSILTILLKKFSNKDNHIEIYNSIGAKVIDVRASGFENKISLQNLDKGIYFISIENNESTISGLKLIVL